MQNRDVEMRIKNAVERLAPDVMDEILAKCEGRAGNVCVVLPQKRKKTWIRAAAALAAAVALAFGGLFTADLINANRTGALIMLDVNPSIEIRINGDDRVIDAAAKNEDALRVLDNMDLKNVRIDVAVNALVGSMLKFGYIQENANSVLLSVESEDGEKGARLQKTIAESISLQLNQLGGAVLSQNLYGDAEVQALSEEYGISYGKAALVQKILAENIHLTFGDLAVLPINELVLLTGSKNIKADGMESRGSASDAAYIGEERAIQAALAHAGIDAARAERMRAELDYDGGIMVYDVEFYCDNTEYDYELNAVDGSVTDFDKEVRYKDEGGREPENSVPQSSDEFIGEGKAAEIAESHAGVASYTGLKVELDKEDGIYVYEVEFDAGGREYGYEINAATGEVLSYEVD